MKLGLHSPLYHSTWVSTRSCYCLLFTSHTEHSQWVATTIWDKIKEDKGHEGRWQVFIINWTSLWNVCLHVQYISLLHQKTINLYCDKLDLFLSMVFIFGIRVAIEKLFKPSHFLVFMEINYNFALQNELYFIWC